LDRASGGFTPGRMGGGLISASYDDGLLVLSSEAQDRAAIGQIEISRRQTRSARQS
jgi:hypothetical protein